MMRSTTFSDHVANIVLSLALGVTPTDSPDSQLFDNGAEGINAGWASFHRRVDGTRWQTYDDFMLSGGWTWKVTHAQWAGMFFDESAGVFVSGVGTDQAFEIVIRADDGTETYPKGGANLGSEGIIARRRIYSSGDPYLGGVALYSAEFDPITLEGGKRYWISFVAMNPAVPSDNGHWSWANSCCGGNSVQGHPGLGTWIRHSGRQHFVLFGHASKPKIRAVMAGAYGGRRCKSDVKGLPKKNHGAPKPGALLGTAPH